MDREKLLQPVRYGRALLASGIHGFPAHKMTTIGVTGTDGKTTTCNLIYHILKSHKKKVGLVSTIAAKIFDGENEQSIDTGFHVTTPDSFDLQKLLKLMVDASCEFAVIECTSHALAQERLGSLTFDVGVVTNITHEHLDYHKTFDKYVLAKGLLFRKSTIGPSRDRAHIAVINQDDQAWDLFKPYIAGWDVVGYGFNDFSKYRIVNPRSSLRETTFSLIIQNDFGDPVSSEEVRVPLVGEYNMQNVAAALAACTQLALPISLSVQSLATFKQLPGRFEIFSTSSHGTVVVDFAHTPNALHRLLTFGKSVTSGAVIAVFGSAGLRDVDKRSLMGEVAGNYASITIITAEDPRTETVSDISTQIASGARIAGAEEYPAESLSHLGDTGVQDSLREHFPLFMRVEDRKKAIITAIALSRPGDTVFVCGKGHEQSMCYGTTEVPWSDQAAVTEAISLLES